MQALVLGSAAGGGFPQWNCRCRNCDGARTGRVRARPRTQSSLALSADGERWLLVNPSPDVLTQLAREPRLQPREGIRHTPLAGVLLTDAQVDHSTGLMMLREGCPLEIWTTAPVRADLELHYPLLPVLRHWHGGFRPREIPLDGDATFTMPFLAGLQLRAVPLRSNAPPFSPRRDEPAPGDNIGLFVTDTRDGSTLFYAPGLGAIDDAVRQAFHAADCLLVDGTFWRDDELAEVGLHASARALGHIPLAGADGLLDVLAALDNRRILVHVNNTNPVLDEDSDERALLRHAGIEVAEDGLLVEPRPRPRASAANDEDSRVVAVNPAFRLQWEPRQDAWVLLFPEGMVQLNESAGLILSQLRTPMRVQDLLATVRELFPGEPVEADVREFLQDAREQRWLVDHA